MRTLIFQINIPNSIVQQSLTAYTYVEEMYKVSEQNAKKYAKKYKADYYAVKTKNDFLPAAHKHIDFQKLKMYDFLDYDAILYLDSDYIIKDNAPNIFEICANKFAAVKDVGKSVPELAKGLEIPEDRYFNAGFMHIPTNILKETKQSLLSNYIHKEYKFDGQGCLNKMFYEHGINFYPLKAEEWNPVKKTFGLYGDHYAGTKKRRWGQVQY